MSGSEAILSGYLLLYCWQNAVSAGDWWLMTNRCLSVIDRYSYHKLVTCSQTHTHCSPVYPAYSLMRMTQCMTSSGT